ncbi:MAG: hypothetical protein ACFCUO_12030, partial [Rhodospirillales bacterium]
MLAGSSVLRRAGKGADRHPTLSGGRGALTRIKSYIADCRTVHRLVSAIRRARAGFSVTPERKPARRAHSSLRFFAETAKAAKKTPSGFTRSQETIMAEDLRQGDRVAWHNRPQFTPEPHDVKR